MRCREHALAVVQWTSSSVIVTVIVIDITLIFWVIFWSLSCAFYVLKVVKIRRLDEVGLFINLFFQNC